MFWLNDMTMAFVAVIVNDVDVDLDVDVGVDVSICDPRLGDVTRLRERISESHWNTSWYDRPQIFVSFLSIPSWNIHEQNKITVKIFAAHSVLFRPLNKDDIS